ncbi:hypothetical protein CYMTET_44897 [Cymbomonas tetramitiformis]|uniref:Uncharacterized protein n=1 Tax=Cymbomonas tetramitiformis TaxID=36881 RepID=A0AAE0C108_9CHLO|nr:hypothetical protein CYMTET_44897 [Cymbomonas tetramitiformis]
MVGAGSDLGRSWAAATLALLMAQEQGDYCKKLMLKAGGFMPILTLSGLADKRRAMPVSEQVASNARAALAALALSPDAASQLRQLQGGDFLQSGRQDLLALCTRTGARQPRQVVITTPKLHRDSRPSTPLVPILSRPNSVQQQIPPVKPHAASRPSSGSPASAQLSEKSSTTFAAPPGLLPFGNTAAAGYGSLDEDSRLVNEEAELLLGDFRAPDDLEMAKLLREEMERLKEETLKAEQSAEEQARFEELEADQLLQEEMIYTLDSRAGRSKASRTKMR